MVFQCAKPERLYALRENYPHAVLLPVVRRNVLPMALADAIGLPVCREVYCLDSMPRKELSAMERLMHRPRFAGNVKPGTDYILVDDVVTQGGTMMALCDFVVSQGARVVAVAALAFATGASVIAPTQVHIDALENKFGMSVLYLLYEYGIISPHMHLSASQVRYLLKFHDLASIEKSMEDSLKQLAERYGDGGVTLGHSPSVTPFPRA